MYAKYISNDDKFHALKSCVFLLFCYCVLFIDLSFSENIKIYCENVLFTQMLDTLTVMCLLEENTRVRVTSA